LYINIPYDEGTPTAQACSRQGDEKLFRSKTPSAQRTARRFFGVLIYLHQTISSSMICFALCPLHLGVALFMAIA
jgi:hypothetical protein